MAGKIRNMIRLYLNAEQRAFNETQSNETQSNETQICISAYGVRRIERKQNFLMLLITALFMSIVIRCSVYAVQEPEFRLDMDSLNLKKGVSANIVISLLNAQGAQVLDVEGLENFDLVSKSQSVSTSYINGATSYQEDLFYTVIPKTAGEFTLKVNIQYNGQAYETNKLQVTVTEGSVSTGQPAQDLFIKTIPSHTDAYLGEKIVLTYVLYSRYNLENYGFTNYTAIDGVIAKDVPDGQLKADYVYLDGERYAMYEVRQLILDPLKSGVLTIPSFNFQVNVITSNNIGGGFGGFFNTSTPMYLQTEEISLNIKPLPTEGKPDNFSGIVGELSLNSHYSREEMDYGDSFTLQVTAYGRCNLDGMKSITNGEVPGVSVYETQKNLVESVADNRYHVQKNFEAIMVPEKTGALDIEPISISYFNPVTEKYEYAEIPGVNINVLGNMPQLSGSTEIFSSSMETITIDQVNYADKMEGYFVLQIKKGLVYWLLIGLAILAILAAGLILLIMGRKKRDKELKTLYKQLMSTNDINDIYNLFNAMIKHCYKLSLKSSPKHVICGSVPDNGLADKITEIMDYVESPKPVADKAAAHLKQKISVVYRTMIKNIRPV